MYQIWQKASGIQNYKTNLRKINFHMQDLGFNQSINPLALNEKILNKLLQLYAKLHCTKKTSNKTE